MKKIERLNGIIYLIKERKRISAREIADYFEVSLRTVYRDIDALSQIKVPVISYEGVGGGYEIDDAYFLPTVQLSDEELNLLMLALMVGKEIQVPGSGLTYEMLSLKLKNVLYSQKSRNSSAFLDSCVFYTGNIRPNCYPDHLLKTLIRSFEQKLKLRITYFTPLTNQINDRLISPYRLEYDLGGWYLVAYCHLRESKRMFRLDRIRSMELTTLESEADKCLPFIDKERVAMEAGYTIEIDEDLYRLILQDTVMCGHEILSDSPMTLKLYAHENNVLELIMRNPDKVKMIEPESLIMSIRERTEHLINNYYKP
jgi:predicted DNA-binding transcriptional regulator YafY